MSAVRKCPHGVNIGPLDDYDVPEDERVFSTYCAECYYEQTGRYPDDQDWGAYTWPEGEKS